MKVRMLFLALIPCLFVGCGMEAEPEGFRTIPAEDGDDGEPCVVEDCDPMDPGPPEWVCPPHMEIVVHAECIDGGGTCEWDIWYSCQPLEGGHPPDDAPPPPSEGAPRPIAPAPAP